MADNELQALCFDVTEQNRINVYSLFVQSQFQMFFSDYALILHDKIVTELRGREALTPYLLVQQARHFQIYFGYFQGAIGFNSLFQIVRAEQLAANLPKGGDKNCKV